MADSYLTDEELAAAQKLHQRNPYVITGISHGMFSIARHFGGMEYQGESYLYRPESDECVRADVMKFVEKMRRAARKKIAKQPEQQGLGI